jgi:uncharacterized membrane protein
VRRTILFVVAGLLLGAAVHIATVLSVPMNAVNDAWARTAALGADNAFHMLPVPAPGTLPALSRDPHVIEAACRFSLREGPARLTAAMPDGFWSLALFDRLGRNLYSINDRAGDATRLDITVMTPEAQVALGEARLAALQNSIVAVLAIDAGMAVIRVFVGDATQEPGARAALAAANCNAPL